MDQRTGRVTSGPKDGAVARDQREEEIAGLKIGPISDSSAFESISIFGWDETAQGGRNKDAEGAPREGE